MSQVPTPQQEAELARRPSAKERGVDLPTLAITAVASAVALYVCSKLWQPGTLAFAAALPVVIAIVKEALRRPTEVVVETVPVPVPGMARRRERRTATPDEPTEVAGAADLPEPAIVAVTPPAVKQTVTLPQRRHWKVAIVTGLLGFGICAGVVTGTELVSGRNGTILFGGETTVKQQTTTTTTATSTVVVVPGETVTTTAPTTTATVPATTVTAPATTVTEPPATVTTTPTTTVPAPTTPDGSTTPTTP